MESQSFKKSFQNFKRPNTFIVIYREHCSKVNMQFGVMEQLLIGCAKSCTFQTRLFAMDL